MKLTSFKYLILPSIALFTVLWNVPVSAWRGDSVECYRIDPDTGGRHITPFALWNLPARVVVNYTQGPVVQCIETSTGEVAANIDFRTKNWLGDEEISHSHISFNMCNSKSNIFGYHWAWCEKEDLVADDIEWVRGGGGE